MFIWGFWKVAKESDPKERRIKGALLGAGTAALTYAALRRGKKTHLARTSEHKRPDSALMRMLHRIAYGADDVLYTSGAAGKKPQSYKGTVLHTQAGDGKIFRGTSNIGKFTEQQEKALSDKFREHQLLKKVDRKHPKASLLASVSGSGEKKLRQLLNKMPKGFLVKHREGYGSGVGGAAFLKEDDFIRKYLAGGKMKKPRAKALHKAIRNPEKFLVQEKLNIKKDPLTGASREIRVHAIGNKVIRGAGSPRGANVLDHLYTRQAEDYFQKVLNKMPKSQINKNMTWAPDIALTDKGMRVIETNRGPLSSGLLDPKFLLKTHGPIKGGAAAAKAIMANNAIYKHITGRHTPIAAAGRAAATGTLASAAYGAATRPRFKADGTQVEE